MYFKDGNEFLIPHKTGFVYASIRRCKRRFTVENKFTLSWSGFKKNKFHFLQQVDATGRVKINHHDFLARVFSALTSF